MRNMIRFSLSFLALFMVTACSSSDPFDFAGTWDGSFSKLENSCPFTVNQIPGDLFPMSVNKDSAGAFVVSAANGDVANGKQGRGEVISFTANASAFGSFGDTQSYTCKVSPYTLGYLEQGDKAARVTLLVIFSACASATDSKNSQKCSVLYSGDAVQR